MTLFGDGDAGDSGINPDSPAQVLAALKALGADITDTQDDTLKAVARQGGPAGEAAAALAVYRAHEKALSAYLDPIPGYVHPITGRIHPSYRQLNRNGVGRFSAESPNIQQIPREKEYRRAFVPGHGNVFVIADYSAIELRIMAWLSGDPTLTQAFLDGKDPHRVTAGLVMGKPSEEVLKEERQLAKALNFGLIYGMSANGLRAYAASGYGVEMSEIEAKRFRDKFFATYPTIQAWHRQQDALVRQAREVRTASGRCRRWSSRDIPATQTYNTPDQGTGADILKRAMARLRPHLIRLGAELVASVHDELVTEVPEDRAEELLTVQKAEMVAAGEEFLAPVPVEVEAAAGRSWADKG